MAAISRMDTLLDNIEARIVGVVRDSKFARLDAPAGAYRLRTWHPEPPPAARLRSVISLEHEQPVMTPDCCKLAEWMASYYGCGLNSVLETVLPAAVRKGVRPVLRRLLTLIAHQGIPPQVLPMLLPKIDNIPFGKGIAGCAAQRKEAVQLCNLQEDLGGVAKPDARKTNVQGALAVPIVGDDGKVLGVLGIGKMQTYDFNVHEIADLNSVAALLAPKM